MIFLTKITLDLVIGVVIGTLSSYAIFEIRKALHQYKLNKILLSENINLRKEKKEVEVIAFKNQQDIATLQKDQEELRSVALQCLESIGEITRFKDSESLNATYAATLRFRKKFGIKDDQTT